jgi:hypothetical protein
MGKHPSPGSISSGSNRYRPQHASFGDNWWAGMIGDRWNVTHAETDRRYPCDDLVAKPSVELWRGVTVRTAPANVWPWVSQIRIAPYSYDWIDNLGRRSPQELRELPEPLVGERFSTAFGGRPVGRILAVANGEHLTAKIMGTVMSYVLVPLEDGHQTRLLLKIAARTSRLATPLLAVGDLVMARRQLLNLAALAERAQQA